MAGSYSGGGERQGSARLCRSPRLMDARCSVIVTMVVATAAAMSVCVAVTMIMIVMMAMVVIMIAAASAAMALVMIVMLVRSVVAMVMIAVIMPAMLMIVMTGGRLGRGGGIDAAFRIERRLDGERAPAERLGHRLDHRIAANAQPLADDLHRQLPMTEMPGDSRHMRQIVAANLGQRLGCRHHFDQPAVIQHQSIAAAQRQLLLKIEQKRQPAGAGQRGVPAAPCIKIEHDRVGRRLCPMMLSDNFAGADHRCCIQG